MSLTEHLVELRKRITRSLIALGIGFGGCYYYKDWIFDIVTRPLTKALPKNSYLIYTGLTEAFFTYMKLAFFASLIITCPFIYIKYGNLLRRHCIPKKKNMWCLLFFPPLCFLSAAFYLDILSPCLRPLNFLSVLIINICRQ